MPFPYSCTQLILWNVNRFHYSRRPFCWRKIKWNHSSDVDYWSGEEVIIQLVINPSNTAIFPTDCKQNNSLIIAFSSFLSMYIRTQAQYCSTSITLHNNYRFGYSSFITPTGSYTVIYSKNIHSKKHKNTKYHTKVKLKAHCENQCPYTQGRN